MNYRDLQIKDYYDGENSDNIGTDFIEKVLLCSRSYKRAVGFFSSSSLEYTSRGLIKVASHHRPFDPPVIQFIVSPKLSEEDVQAIKLGYKNKTQVIEESMLREWKEPISDFSKERLNVLCHLISSGAMDIKVAVTEENKDDTSMGMFHIKFGVMEDEEGNKVAFSGSLNESENAFQNNFEGIEVFKSWQDATRVKRTENRFTSLFEGNGKKVKIYKFPEAVKEQLFKYKRPTYDIDIDEHERESKEITICKNMLPTIKPECLPSFPYDYQMDAINTWVMNKGIGIFDMATGTGKTYTALGAMVAMLVRNKYHMATIVAVPYQHLVEQWVEDAKKFNINNIIIGYSSSKYKNYKSELRQAVIDFNEGIRDYFYFFCTYSTYKLPDVQEILSDLNNPVLFVADEAHNCGSGGMLQCLNSNFKYRLGLSATIERYRDEDGTQRIFDYFGKKCIEYPLSRAMEEGKLTQYNYYPIPVYLDEIERNEYIDISKKLAKAMAGGDGTLSSYAESLAIQRARLVAGASGKVSTLITKMKDYVDKHYILVYCGTSKIEKDCVEEVRQVDEVVSILGKDMGMRVRKYTSEENTNEREEIKHNFETGNDLQALVAIKCLDEGVNIPAIRTAFILASSTNPREYIQRRGRVLRLSEGKDRADIFDFVCFPVADNQLQNVDQDDLKVFRSLVKNEINRVLEFGKYAINSSESFAIVEEAKKKYGLYDFDAEDELAMIRWRDEKDV